MIGAITAGLFSAGTPPVTNSYESISTVTVGSGGSGTISFTSIPSTYKHLQIRGITLSSSSNNDIITRFNSDSGSNYSLHLIYGTGSAAAAYGAANTTYGFTGYTGSTTAAGAFVLDILDYADTNKYKTTRTLNGNDQNGSGYMTFGSGAWRNTNAISSITITHGGAVTFTQYSSFALYGIKG